MRAARAGLQVDRSTHRPRRVPAHGPGCYAVAMTSPATVRLMGLLVIVGMVAGCGEEDALLASQRDVARTRIPAASLTGIWTVDTERLREAFEAHLAEEVEACAAVRDEAAVEEMLRRLNEQYARVQGSFAESILALSSDGEFHFREGFAWSLGERRGTWRLRGKELILTVQSRPDDRSTTPCLPTQQREPPATQPLRLRSGDSVTG